jgi:hypothetical protein
VIYNPAKVPVDAPFDVEDTFIHGVIQGNGGTCASMPVVYAAVGRRLGYPIKLVSVQSGNNDGHGFCRWEGEGERFNIEGTAGLNTPPDDYYRRGRFEMTAEQERLGCYLLSKTPRMELSRFVAERAYHWEDAGNLRRCVEGLAWAVSLHPKNALLENTLKLKTNEWIRWANDRKPSGFPSVWITPPSRRLFPDTLSLDHERVILGQMATENLLLDPEYEKIWERMRRGEWRRKGPNTANVVFRSDGSSEIEVEFKA